MGCGRTQPTRGKTRFCFHFWASFYVAYSRENEIRYNYIKDRYDRYVSSLVLLRLNERDLVIDALMADGSNSIKLWALHSAVRAGNGFESVRLLFFFHALAPTNICARYPHTNPHDEWPVIGVALGFPPAAGGNAGQPPRCGCIIAHRLQLLYNDLLRDFNQVYLGLNSPAARSRSSDQLPALQSTEADHQTFFLASITSEPSVKESQGHRCGDASAS